MIRKNDKALAITLVAACGVAVSSWTRVARADAPVENIRVVPAQVFIPPGFDSNDNAQVVMDGYLPNTCYKLGLSSARVDREARKIYLEQRAYYHPQGWCLQVLVHYSETVALGPLPEGRYQVVVLDGSGQERPKGELPVAAATSPAPDDFLYAPVRDAYVDSAAGTPDAPVLVLTGDFGNDCMSIREVRTLYRTPNVTEVLPIVDVKSGAICQQIPRPFAARVTLRAPFRGPTLIHVRSLNGQAINKVVDLL